MAPNFTKAVTGRYGIAPCHHRKDVFDAGHSIGIGSAGTPCDSPRSRGPLIRAQTFPSFPAPRTVRQRGTPLWTLSQASCHTNNILTSPYSSLYSMDGPRPPSTRTDPGSPQYGTSQIPPHPAPLKLSWSRGSWLHNYPCSRLGPPSGPTSPPWLSLLTWVGSTPQSPRFGGNSRPQPTDYGTPRTEFGSLPPDCKSRDWHAPQTPSSLASPLWLYPWGYAWVRPPPSVPATSSQTLALRGSGLTPKNYHRTDRGAPSAHRRHMSWDGHVSWFRHTQTSEITSLGTPPAPSVPTSRRCLPSPVGTTIHSTASEEPRPGECIRQAIGWTSLCNGAVGLPREPPSSTLDNLFPTNRHSPLPSPSLLGADLREASSSS